MHILQIGDSHTAGDMITSGWRTPLQAAPRRGGRGVLAAGRPYQGYLTWGVTASQSAGWTVNATFGARYQEAGAPLGISGFTQTARAAGETLGVDRGFARAEFRPGDRLRDHPAGRRHRPAPHGRERRHLVARRAAPHAGLPDDGDRDAGRRGIARHHGRRRRLDHLLRDLPSPGRRRPLQSRRGRRAAHPFRPQPATTSSAPSSPPIGPI